MGVKVRERKSGEFWLLIDHKGQRKAVKVGTKEAAKKAAAKVDEAISTVKLDLNPPETSPPVWFGEYANKWMAGYVEHNLKWNSRRYSVNMLKRNRMNIRASRWRRLQG